MKKYPHTKTNLVNDKYTIGWCDLCNTATITCPECKYGSCSGGGCEKCTEDFKNFSNRKTRISDYLNDEEKLIYNKILSIKKFIINHIGYRDEIDFKHLKKEGQMSRYEEDLFYKELQ